MERVFAIPRREGVARTIVLITDGYIEAEKDVFDYVRDHLDRGNVFCFGIGSSVNRYLLEGVARAGRALRRHEAGRSGGGGGGLPRVHPVAGADRYRGDLLGLRRVRRGAGQGPGPVRAPTGGRVRQVAGAAAGNDRAARPHGAGSLSGVLLALGGAPARGPP